MIDFDRDEIEMEMAVSLPFGPPGAHLDDLRDDFGLANQREVRAVLSRLKSPRYNIPVRIGAKRGYRSAWLDDRHVLPVLETWWQARYPSPI